MFTDVLSASDMLGIIIITVVCCAVGTSVVWVFIIYHSRKKISQRNATTAAMPEPVVVDFSDKVLQFVDTVSDNSSCKDSGTGDSAKRSNDDLLPDEYTLIINGRLNNREYQVCIE